MAEAQQQPVERVGIGAGELDERGTIGQKA